MSVCSRKQRLICENQTEKNLEKSIVLNIRYITGGGEEGGGLGEINNNVPGQNTDVHQHFYFFLYSVSIV